MTVGLQIPIRWMAPEVLSGQPQYFYASDVWSMGVVVWQLLTRHAEPYPDVPDMMAVVHGYAPRTHARQPRSTGVAYDGVYMPSAAGTLIERRGDPYLGDAWE